MSDLTLDLIGIEDALPLSSAQQGLLFHSLSAPETGVYVTQQTCLLRGQLDVAAFTKSWQQVMQRHAILRTAFETPTGGEPEQVVLRSVRTPLERRDWRGVPETENDASLAG